MDYFFIIYLCGRAWTLLRMHEECSVLLPTLCLFAVVIVGALASIPLIVFGKHILCAPITYVYNHALHAADGII